MKARPPHPFRDKTDIRPLPPIPDELAAGLHELIETRINAPGLTLFQRLEAVYAHLDRYNAFVATFAVCRKGCSYCCRIDVDIGQLEAEYIALKSGAPLDAGSTRTTGHRDACPFLARDGSCSVYAARPFNCRTFHTLDDPKYCADGDEDHQTYGAAGAGYGVSAYALLARWLKGVHERRGAPYRDIRDWFPGAPAKQSLLNRLFRRG
jgi:Fe-S-cluster containining protein